jgi:hypothetical protein
MGNLPPVWSEYDLRSLASVRMVAKTTFVCGLFGSWEGMISSDVARSRSVVILVDCIFFCSTRRWPLLVAGDLGRCLVMRVVVRPGHNLK